jgi:hypothetical protein
MLLAIIMIICVASTLLGAYEMYVECNDIDTRTQPLTGSCSRESKKLRSIAAYLSGTTVAILVAFGFFTGRLSLPTLLK